jgi:two-component system, OmpR family, sensor kinase
MSEKLTKQELSWLLTQEARGAAERLRRGVQILTKAPPPPNESEPLSRKSDRPPQSDRPVTLTSAGEPEGLESTLDLLEGTMAKLSELSGPASARARRGRVDLAALLWEVAPDAKVQLAPGAGTEVFADENELRRMLHVLMGGTQTGVGGAQMVTLKREGEEVRLGVQLGPDTAPISPAERGWLARMAIRYGGRYELDGASEMIVFPALEAEEAKEVKTLRKELEAAKAQGEMYARELAAVFAEEPTQGTRPPDASVGVAPVVALGATARLADALADDLRAVFAPLGAARLKAADALREGGLAPELLDEVQRALGRGAELLALARHMARIASDLGSIPVDLASIAQDEAGLATVAFASRGVVLTVAASDDPNPLVLDGFPAALRALVSEMLDQALRASRPGEEVRIGVAGGALVVERTGDKGVEPWSRAARAFLNEIARAHGIELEVSDHRIVARPPRTG